MNEVEDISGGNKPTRVGWEDFEGDNIEKQSPRTGKVVSNNKVYVDDFEKLKHRQQSTVSSDISLAKLDINGDG